jgi:uncharacterized protein YodC (DUF2158 family)
MDELKKVWESMRRQHADIVAKPMPVKFLVLLCELKEREQRMPRDKLKAGDVVRLKIGSQEMIVSKVIDADTIECTHFDGIQHVRASVEAADVIKVAEPRDPNLPSPKR